MPLPGDRTAGVTEARRGVSDPAWDRLRKELAATWDWQQRVAITGLSGHLVAGATVTARWRASRSTNYVQVHVQTDAVGEGGATYSATLFLSSTRVSCLESRQQDTTIARGAGKRFYLWLIPVMLDGDGSTFVKYDGVDSASDFASFIELGV